MPINVRCPNDACGRMLSVQDDFAGKTGKCPSCGTTMPIPYPPADEAPESSHMPATAEPPVRPEPATAGEPAEHGDAGIPTLVQEEEEIPVRRYRGRPRYSDDDYDDRRPRRRSSGRDRLVVPQTGASAGTIVCLSIGSGLLVFLGLTPLFAMYVVTFPNQQMAPLMSQPGVAGMLSLTEGKILLIISQVMAGLCMAGLIVYLTVPQRVADVFVTVCSCLAGGWAVTALFWILGFIWDIKTTSVFRQTLQNVMETGMEPGVGLWLGLGLSIATVAVFSTVITIRGRTLWLYLGEGIGLIGGVLLLTLNVQPWISGEPNVQPGSSQFANSKLLRRYSPLEPGFHWNVQPKRPPFLGP
jgi:hypothetical protein